MVRLEGIEPPTSGLGNRCSIRLSYRRLGGGLAYFCRAMKALMSVDSLVRSLSWTYIMCPA